MSKTMGQAQSRSSAKDATAAGEKDCEAASDPPEKRDRCLQDEIDELNQKQRKDWERWDGNEHCIIPHTDAAGDQYCIGDAYEGIKLAGDWELKKYVNEVCLQDPANRGKVTRENISNTSNSFPNLSHIWHILAIGWK